MIRIERIKGLAAGVLSCGRGGITNSVALDGGDPWWAFHYYVRADQQHFFHCRAINELAIAYNNISMSHNFSWSREKQQH
jgi:hypothetical protein